MNKSRFLISVLIAFFFLLSCSERKILLDERESNERVSLISFCEDRIVLGRRLNNPYSLSNMKTALSEVLATKSIAGTVPATLEANWLYVRFLPKDSTDVSMLLNQDLELFEYPIDYEILVDGSSYHDPSLPENEITWQYTRVRPDFEFPEGLRYEIIEECYIPEDSESTKSGGDDLGYLLEKTAIELAGFTVDDFSTKGSSRITPAGYVKVYNDFTRSYEPVKGVKIRCNFFLKFDSAYTYSSGLYLMKSYFLHEPHCRLIFDSECDFEIFKTAALSAVSKNYGRTVNGRKDINIAADDELWKFAVINNASYDYYSMCKKENVKTPPKKLRIWCLKSSSSSSAPMLKHCGMSIPMLVKYYSTLCGLTPLTLSSLICLYGVATVPDIIIGVEGRENADYASTYGTVWHELTHASHFSSAGEKLWSKYIDYVVTSQISTGDCYGDGSSTKEGRYICELGESWAYANERILKRSKYSLDYPSGDNNWFYPSIDAMCAIRDCTDVSLKDFYEILTDATTRVPAFFQALCDKHPSDTSVIRMAMAVSGHLNDAIQWNLYNNTGGDLYVDIERDCYPITHYMENGEKLCIAGMPSYFGTEFRMLETHSFYCPNRITIYEYSTSYGSNYFYGTFKDGVFLKSKRKFKDLSNWEYNVEGGCHSYTFTIQKSDGK